MGWFCDEGVRALTTGLETTLRLLKKTPNEAALRVLIPAIDSPSEEIRHAALETLLAHRNLAGHKAVVSRFHTLDDNLREIVSRNSARVSGALRAAVLGADRQMCENGCTCAVRFHEYDLISPLISALEDKTNPNVDLVGNTLLELARALSQRLLLDAETSDHRDPRAVLKYVMGSLSGSVDRFGLHGRRETIEAFALLVGRDNVTLGQVLATARHPAFLVLMETLAKSQDEAVIELILSFLDDPRAPSAILSVATKRSDIDFIRRLLGRIGHEPSLVVTQNLKRMGAIPWLAADAKVIGLLNDAEQESAIALAMLSRTARENAFSLIQHVLLHGQPTGRRAASEALADFNGAEANVLTLKALDDPEPRVQANAARQIRHRGIPGALPLLVKMVDSPHSEVREVARTNLVEFSFQRFLGAYDILDDVVRQSTGELVKKIDPDTPSLLDGELTSKVRTRRLRGLAMARTLHMVGQLQETVVKLLFDKDHIVRANAATALGECEMSPRTIAALTETLKDNSASVCEAAGKSLNSQLARAGGTPASSRTPATPTANN